MQQTPPAGGWESKAIQDILHSHLVEQRRSRRWKIFFRLLIALYVLLMTVIMVAGNTFKSPESSKSHVAVVEVKGTIEDESRSGANAEAIIKGLNSAFEAKNAKAVMLLINSPGGSPVQSAQVYREIMRLKAKHPNRPVYAVTGDIAASGAYYIASAADFIYADPSSLVGSVGVIMSGFGFTEVMDRVGVERRVYTAGENKAFMDPFMGENPKTVGHVNTLLEEIHKEFIGAVRKGRGDRIKGEDKDLFNGLIWTGSQAVALGLVDGLGSPREVAREKLNVETLVNYTHAQSALERLSNRVSSNFAKDLVQTAAGELSIR